MGNPSDPAPRLSSTSCASRPRSANHRYSVSKGLFISGERSQKYKAKWGVSLDQKRRSSPVSAARRGLLTCAWPCWTGDTTVVETLISRFTSTVLRLAGANVIKVTLGNDEAFLERIEYVVQHLYPRPKLIILNYPHNPTAMTVEARFSTVSSRWPNEPGSCDSRLCLRRDVLENYRSPCFLGAKGAKECGVESAR